MRLYEAFFPFPFLLFGVLVDWGSANEVGIEKNGMRQGHAIGTKSDD